MGIDLSPGQFTEVQAILRLLSPQRPVWAFGSRVRGGARRYSDLDLAIVGDGPLPPGQLLDLQEAFDASDLPFRVDILDWARISPAFQAIIAGEHVELIP